MSNFIDRCLEAVWQSIDYDWEMADVFTDKCDELFESLKVVWFSKTLQNHKALVMSTNSLFDHTYWEVTYNGDKDEYYVDEYKKQSNKVILGADIDETI